MLKEEIHEIISRRIKLHIEDAFGLQNCWDKEIEFLSRNMLETIFFIENESSDEIFCWLGEVFDDVVEITQSKEFLETIKKRADRVIDEKSRRFIETDIRYAENNLCGK